MKEKEAEEQEQIVHIHFDAKYKIANLNDMLSNDISTLDADSRSGIYKNADLLKMHAYKDAIKRTSGAYVLYPGTKKKVLRGFHEVLPGLGAFAIAPSAGTNETAELEVFLDRVLQHFLNRASQRENLASKTYEITKKRNDELKDKLPEYIGTQKLIPDETYVLVGFYKSDEHLEWIKKSGTYNFRTDTRSGSIILDKYKVSAKFLLLHKKGDETSGKLFRIIEDGAKVYSPKKMEKLKYPSEKYEDHYLILHIDKEIPSELKGLQWRFKKLGNWKTKRQSAEPYTASLSELMRNKVKL